MARLLSLALFTLLATACSDNKTQPPSYSEYQGAEPTPLSCVPNLDGRIDANEAQPAIGAQVSYLVSPADVERPVDLLGVDLGGGRFRYTPSRPSRLSPPRARWPQSVAPPRPVREYDVSS